MSGETDRQREREIERQTDIDKYIHKERVGGRQKETNRKKRDRQGDIEKETQTDIKKVKERERER